MAQRNGGEEDLQMDPETEDREGATMQILSPVLDSCVMY
jgi:hypothetical protein